ncbi:MAG: HNH endonuclease family protein [Bifidobacteriaceae bacterium]|nr:HNH endonuclease family protein [Bifidobacteriaceae bacterium]
MALALVVGAVGAQCSDFPLLGGSGGQTGLGGWRTASGNRAAAEAIAALDSLPEAAPADAAPKYEREEFLPGGWADLDGDGCYTRNEILRRDLAEVVFEDGWCKVASGLLRDPYTGAEIAFDKAESTTTVQIDHVIPLAQAWRAGAWAWTKEERKAFANDPAELLAVAGAANQSKGDSGPAEWLPDQGRCDYAQAYATVAGKYRIGIGQTDRDTLRQILSNC